MNTVSKICNIQNIGTLIFFYFAEVIALKIIHLMVMMTIFLISATIPVSAESVTVVGYGINEENDFNDFSNVFACGL